MKTSHAILAITLGAAALSGSVFAESSNDRAAAAAQGENWLAIPAIYDKVTAAGYSDISEIEREDDGYEVKGRNAEGERVKLYVDPRSGEVLDARAKGDKSKSDKADNRSSSWWSSDKR
ncbi:MAG: PepSY domain-containing protein [Gammaproteobacteria bacterium]|nr:PepSY domain-containing protein [Gammaproteobacteria bacterium]MCW8841504.1 PepSY domain-containing protein [Gammaproteobacteria bacterium]MCW8958030.1 PepSY domain-containing protein [Gammaproteobacteria bacterium]MCW8974058.1 PepSY domain-containing protein [Gammaproteobacteria bacterium]MCW8993896.1 PepSY domain-containing protein [Gammaproteobacteria bacterium]